MVALSKQRWKCKACKFQFTRLIENWLPIPMFGDGTTERDYTYIDDIIQGIAGAIDYDKSSFEVFNLGESQAIPLNKLISCLEKALGKKAVIEHQPLQPGDVLLTCANISKARKLLGYNPHTSIEEGLNHFVEWYRHQQFQLKKSIINLCLRKYLFHC